MFCSQKWWNCFNNMTKFSSIDITWFDRSTVALPSGDWCHRQVMVLLWVRIPTLEYFHHGRRYWSLYRNSIIGMSDCVLLFFFGIDNSSMLTNSKPLFSFLFLNNYEFIRSQQPLLDGVDCIYMAQNQK